MIATFYALVFRLGRSRRPPVSTALPPGQGCITVSPWRSLPDAFFDALAYLVVEWLDHETPLCLPTTSDPLVAAAMAYTNEHLADVSLPEVCAAVGTSERSLRRAFVAATAMSWRRYLLESRLLKAMALLAQDGQNQNVLAIALAVGFQSVSAFTRAFGQYAGESPTAYRQRVRAR